MPFRGFAPLQSLSDRTVTLEKVDSIEECKLVAVSIRFECLIVKHNSPALLEDEEPRLGNPERAKEHVFVVVGRFRNEDKELMD